MKVLDSLKFDRNGLLPAIVQESDTGEVLMMAYMNREALELTLRSGQTHFYSRSRKKLWHKGETSGNVQSVEGVFADCDCDTILIKVKQTGAACHEGYRSCFYRKLGKHSGWEIVGSPMFDPEKIYGKK
jgi:phosphoribosyl-ATP pyrophosphohydrolase/phosphoribosyl-AMP cyclohydrolase